VCAIKNPAMKGQRTVIGRSRSKRLVTAFPLRLLFRLPRVSTASSGNLGLPRGGPTTINHHAFADSSDGFTAAKPFTLCVSRVNSAILGGVNTLCVVVITLTGRGE
jgi:hypothetical protein